MEGEFSSSQNLVYKPWEIYWLLTFFWDWITCQTVEKCEDFIKSGTAISSGKGWTINILISVVEWLIQVSGFETATHCCNWRISKHIMNIHYLRLKMLGVQKAEFTVLRNKLFLLQIKLPSVSMSVYSTCTTGSCISKLIPINLFASVSKLHNEEHLFWG